ncbi:MAG: LuxR C-terminal-related transcriptional regulator, partial [Propionibacteriaceae bacterium]|nr:LuxR C-terminal-related transcriptional regulator [Propionibacteriaceae bacterium]
AEGGPTADVDEARTNQLLATFDEQCEEPCRALLRVAALLGEAEPRFLAKLTGRRDLATALPELWRRPLPFVDVGLPPVSVVVHEPLRSLLLEELRAAGDQALAASAVALLVEENQDDNAFDLAQRWGDRELLTKLVYTRGAHHSLQGNPRHLAKWLSAFTLEEIDADPRLQLVAAIERAATGDLGIVAAWLTAAMEGGVHAKDAGPELPWHNPDAALRAPARDPYETPWVVLGQVMGGFEAACAGRMGEAERMLVAATPFTRNYALLDVWRAVTLAWVYAETRRPELGQPILEYAALRAGHRRHFWLVLLDAMQAYYATVTGDTAEAKRWLRESMAKLAQVRHGMDRLRLVASLQALRAAKWLGDGEAIASLSKDALALALALDEPDIAAEFEAFSGAEAEGPQVVFTPAELKVLRKLGGPSSVPEIAGQLFVSPATVRTHIRSIFGKLSVNDRAGAVEAAQRRGLMQ